MTELLTSAEAAVLIGVGPTAIKRWADAGVLPCIRTAGRHRRFDRAEVEAFLRGSRHTAPSDAGSGPTRDHTRDHLYDRWIPLFVGETDPLIVTARLLTERAACGSWTRVAETIGEVLKEMGLRWRDGRLSVIQEHVASTSLERALASICQIVPVPPDAPRCLLAAASGDDHTLGLSLVELCLRELGWRSEWAGRRTRPADIAEWVARGTVQMVALSASEASNNAADLDAQAREVGDVCRRAGVTVVFGGEGAWPDPPPYGYRLSSLRSLRDIAAERATSPAAAAKR